MLEETKDKRNGKKWHGLDTQKQGQGKFTVDKEYGYNRVIAQWLSIVNNILQKHKAWAKPYILYVDMNAGSGYNEEADCAGSPLEFFLEAERHGFTKKAFFIERNPESCSDLMEIFSAYSTNGIELSICNGDSVGLLPDLVDKYGSKAYGVIYFDPNGIKMNAQKNVFDVAREISLNKNFKLIEILIRISGTNYKRIRRTFPGKYPALKDQLQSINKSKWICRKIAIDEQGHRDPWQWTFLLGTNWTDYRAWENEGFYPIDDPRSDFAIINNTISEGGDASASS